MKPAGIFRVRADIRVVLLPVLIFLNASLDQLGFHHIKPILRIIELFYTQSVQLNLLAAEYIQKETGLEADEDSPFTFKTFDVLRYTYGTAGRNRYESQCYLSPLHTTDNKKDKNSRW